MQTSTNGTEKKVKNLQELFDSGQIHQFQEEDFINQARDFMEQNLLVDCKLLFEEGLKKFPKSSKLYFEFGYFLFENDKTQPAKENLMKVGATAFILEPNPSPLSSTSRTLRLCSLWPSWRLI